MSLDTARPESRPERLTAREARLRLEHERDSRLVQLKAIEEAGSAVGDDLAVTQKDSLRRVLKEVDAAFARVEEGVYGVCQGCAQSIPLERLEILPYVRCCVGCQRRAT